jgi:hypothetical protein
MQDHISPKSRYIKSNALCMCVVRFSSYQCIPDSAKTMRLLALDFYEVIVDSGFNFALINYHLIEILSLYQLLID